jgi:chromosome partitioning protein
VVIPCQCDYLSTHGVDQVMRLIEVIRKKAPILRFSPASCLPCWIGPAILHGLIFSKIKDLYAGETIHTVIEMDGALKEAQIMSMPAIHYSRQSAAGTQYLELAEEIIASMNDAVPSSP